ncbi:sensor histidine kinase [Tellurirhabdus rosea]|uniref:sensor histidine kinase n=1 Tax=Tellurirhabdus rosea TaxID=2674997 RepID=UPI0022566A69|nr:sensor histidine kinase [Tellurirhabdus rosea]
MTDELDVLNKPEPPSSRRFTRLFGATLIIVAVLLSVGQVVTQVRLERQVDVIRVLRVSALQRHLSQQITKEALHLTQSSDSAEFARSRENLRTIYKQFVSIYLSARAGGIPGSDLRIPYSDSIKARYQAIAPTFNILEKNAQQLIRKAEKAGSARDLNAQQELAMLARYDEPFLKQFDGIIQQTNRETIANTSALQRLELYQYFFTLIVLAVIGWLIIRPAVVRLEQTIRQLIEAENRTATANRKLLSLNRTLKETRQQLFDATRQQYQQQMDEQKLRTSYLLAGQEEERKRLSRELHDGIGQMLTAIKLQIESLETGLQGEGKSVKNIGALKSLVTQTIQEARNVSNNLMPTVLSDFGLIPALKMLADTHGQNSPIEIIFHSTFPDVRFDKNMEVVLYRITQEAVSNAVRHANPHQITIELFEKDAYLHLLVCDDGTGFRVHRNGNPEGSRRSQGLHNMRERAALINAKFRISSAPDKGTKVQVSIPIKIAYPEYEYDQTDAGR